jgi:hypothetical protein
MLKGIHISLPAHQWTARWPWIATLRSDRCALMSTCGLQSYMGCPVCPIIKCHMLAPHTAIARASSACAALARGPILVDRVPLCLQTSSAIVSPPKTMSTPSRRYFPKFLSLELLSLMPHLSISLFESCISMSSHLSIACIYHGNAPNDAKTSHDNDNDHDSLTNLFLSVSIFVTSQRDLWIVLSWVYMVRHRCWNDECCYQLHCGQSQRLCCHTIPHYTLLALSFPRALCGAVLIIWYVSRTR